MYRILSSKLDPELLSLFLLLVRTNKISLKLLKKCSLIETKDEIEIYGEGSYSIPEEISCLLKTITAK